MSDNKTAVMSGGPRDGVEWEVPLGINMVKFEHVPGPEDPGPKREDVTYYSTGVFDNGKEVFEIE